MSDRSIEELDEQARRMRVESELADHVAFLEGISEPGGSLERAGVGTMIRSEIRSSARQLRDVITREVLDG